MADQAVVIGLLAALRRSAGLSQRSVAAAMGTTQSAVSELEAGLSDPRLSTVTRYAAVVGAELFIAVRLTVRDSENATKPYETLLPAGTDGLAAPAGTEKGYPS